MADDFLQLNYFMKRNKRWGLIHDFLKHCCFSPSCSLSCFGSIAPAVLLSTGVCAVRTLWALTGQRVCVCLCVQFHTNPTATLLISWPAACLSRGWSLFTLCVCVQASMCVSLQCLGMHGNTVCVFINMKEKKHYKAAQMGRKWNRRRRGTEGKREEDNNDTSQKRMTNLQMWVGDRGSFHNYPPKNNL